MAAVTARPAVRVAHGADALDLLDDRWDELLLRAEFPNPLLSAGWLRRLACLRHGTPLVAIAEEDGALLAGAALETGRRGGRVGPTVATWLGPPEQHCSPDLLVDSGRPEAGEALVSGLLEEVDALSLGTAASGNAARALEGAAPWHTASAYTVRWVLRGPARVDYVRTRAEADVRRAERLGVRVEVRVSSEPDELAPALVRLFRLHRERWAGRSDLQARFAESREHRRWSAAALGDQAALGRVRLAEVSEDGRLVAAALGLVLGAGGLGHTTAMRTGGALRQPGHLASLVRIEAMLAAGATAIDLGHGAGEPGGPKARFAPQAEPLVMFLAARTRSRQRRLAVLRRTRDAVRALA